MKYLEIVLNIPLNQTFTYSYNEENLENQDSDFSPETGKRAELKFGNRKMTGFIVKVHDSFPKDCAVPKEKIRDIIKVLDKEPIFTPEIFELSQWISRYYLCSIGEAVFSVIPSKGRRESKGQGFSFDEEFSTKKTRILSDEQEKAVHEITESAEGKSSFHYLYGPTGTGKTEVFLQCAEWLLNKGKGVIYLVPEIGLTPQVVKAVTERFGNTAAVLHSGLTPSQKLTEWKRILNREARIVVGARSAVFAPVPDLGLIIIDEEHDASYKSGDTPRYHARQAAMHRSVYLKIPLVMGSATPSCEAYHLMKEGKIFRHTLSKRLAGGDVPEIKIIDLSKTNNTGCISEELEQEIRKTVSEKKQTILFLNRRGFTHFFRCNSCGYELKCKNCSVPLTFHKTENRLRCHYCGWSTVTPDSCPKCGSIDTGYSGFGTEYIETETRAKFPEARILRLDTDALTKKGELEEKLNAFRNGQYDILLGTQMIAKGLNFPNLKLVGVISADTGLHMPDFRAGERTFALITQVAGRAGRFFPDGKVLIQSYNPGREPIKYAQEGHINRFYQYELENRKLLNFPPFTRLVRLVFRSPSQALCEQFAEDAASIIRENLKNAGDVIGPAECPISKISQNYRWQIILRGKNIQLLQKASANLLYNYTHPQNLYIECDVDPVSIL